MRRSSLAVALLAALPVVGFGLLSFARAAEGAKSVKAADVPKVVVEALEKKYPKCSVKAWERETKGKKVRFEAKLEVTEKDKDGKEATRTIDVALSDAGKILKEEEAVAVTAMPEAVKKGIEASAFAKGKILRVVRIVLEEKADAPLFEVLVELDGKKKEFVVGAGGKILEDDGDDGDDGDDDEDDDDEDEDEDGEEEDDDD